MLEIVWIRYRNTLAELRWWRKNKLVHRRTGGARCSELKKL